MSSTISASKLLLPAGSTLAKGLDGTLYLISQPSSQSESNIVVNTGSSQSVTKTYVISNDTSTAVSQAKPSVVAQSNVISQASSVTKPSTDGNLVLTVPSASSTSEALSATLIDNAAGAKQLVLINPNTQPQNLSTGVTSTSTSVTNIAIQSPGTDKVTYLRASLFTPATQPVKPSTSSTPAGGGSNNPNTETSTANDVINIVPDEIDSTDVSPQKLGVQVEEAPDSSSYKTVQVSMNGVIQTLLVPTVPDEEKDPSRSKPYETEDARHTVGPGTESGRVTSFSTDAHSAPPSTQPNATSSTSVKTVGKTASSNFIVLQPEVASSVLAQLSKSISLQEKQKNSTALSVSSAKSVQPAPKPLLRQALNQPVRSASEEIAPSSPGDEPIKIASVFSLSTEVEKPIPSTAKVVKRVLPRSRRSAETYKIQSTEKNSSRASFTAEAKCTPSRSTAGKCKEAPERKRKKTSPTTKYTTSIPREGKFDDHTYGMVAKDSVPENTSQRLKRKATTNSPICRNCPGCKIERRKRGQKKIKQENGQDKYMTISLTPIDTEGRLSITMELVRKLNPRLGKMSGKKFAKLYATKSTAKPARSKQRKLLDACATKDDKAVSDDQQQKQHPPLNFSKYYLVKSPAGTFLVPREAEKKSGEATVLFRVVKYNTGRAVAIRTPEGVQKMFVQAMDNIESPLLNINDTLSKQTTDSIPDDGDQYSSVPIKPDPDATEPRKKRRAQDPTPTEIESESDTDSETDSASEGDKVAESNKGNADEQIEADQEEEEGEEEEEEEQPSVSTSERLKRLREMLKEQQSKLADIHMRSTTENAKRVLEEIEQDD